MQEKSQHRTILKLFKATIEKQYKKCENENIQVNMRCQTLTNDHFVSSHLFFCLLSYEMLGQTNFPPQGSTKFNSIHSAMRSHQCSFCLCDIYSIALWDS